MKALTVRQPWAWAIIHGPKRIENRTWRTTYRGPLAIHAGRSTAWLRERLPDGTKVPADPLVFGAIIGLVDVIDCVPVSDAGPDPFASGPFCWILKNPRPLRDPIYCRGAQLLWSAPDNVVTVPTVV